MIYLEAFILLAKDSHYLLCNAESWTIFSWNLTLLQPVKNNCICLILQYEDFFRKRHNMWKYSLAASLKTRKLLISFDMKSIKKLFCLKNYLKDV